MAAAICTGCTFPASEPLSWDLDPFSGGRDASQGSDPSMAGGAGGDLDAAGGRNERNEEAGNGNTDAGGPDAEPNDASSADARRPGREGGVKECKMTVSVKTVTTKLDYDPENIGAIWVATADRKLVHTLSLWAKTRLAHLVLYNRHAAAAGILTLRWSSNTPPMPAAVDAITSASAKNHTAVRTGTWNCSNFKREAVPDGEYLLCIEMTESNSEQTEGDANVGKTAPSRSECIPFVKGEEPFSQTPPDTKYFTGLKLDYSALP